MVTGTVAEKLILIYMLSYDFEQNGGSISPGPPFIAFVLHMQEEKRIGEFYWRIFKAKLI